MIFLFCPRWSEITQLQTSASDKQREDEEEEEEGHQMQLFRAFKSHNNYTHTHFDLFIGEQS